MGKPKFRGQNLGVNPKKINEYQILSVNPFEPFLQGPDPHINLLKGPDKLASPSFPARGCFGDSGGGDFGGNICVERVPPGGYSTGFSKALKRS